MKPVNSIPDPKNAHIFDLLSRDVYANYTSNPFVIAITGAGGAGKTTFGQNIQAYYGSENSISIDLDDYLISRDQRSELGISGYDPLANNLSLALQNIIDLKNFKQIIKPVYDHATGQTLPYETISPRKLIVIEGVTALYPELIGCVDLSFFLDAQEETQIQSRIERDVNKRGYSLVEALQLYESLKIEYERHIEPTKYNATYVMTVNPDYVMDLKK